MARASPTNEGMVRTLFGYIEMYYACNMRDRAKAT